MQTGTQVSITTFNNRQEISGYGPLCFVIKVLARYMVENKWVNHALGQDLSQRAEGS